MWWPFSACFAIYGMNYNSVMEGTPVSDVLLGFKWVSPLLVRTLETKRCMTLIQFLRYKDTPFSGIYLMPKFTEGHRRGSFGSLPACPHLASTSVSLLALDPGSTGIQHTLKTSGDSQPQELNNCWVLRLGIHSQPLLD